MKFKTKIVLIMVSISIVVGAAELLDVSEYCFGFDYRFAGNNQAEESIKQNLFYASLSSDIEEYPFFQSVELKPGENGVTHISGYVNEPQDVICLVNFIELNREHCDYYKLTSHINFDNFRVLTHPDWSLNKSYDEWDIRPLFSHAGELGPSS